MSKENSKKPTSTKPVKPTSTKPVKPISTKPVEPTSTKPVEPKVSRCKDYVLEIKDLIMSGKSNSEIWDIIQPKYNLDEKKKVFAGWYRGDMKRKGLAPPISKSQPKPKVDPIAVNNAMTAMNDYVKNAK